MIYQIMNCGLGENVEIHHPCNTKQLQCFVNEINLSKYEKSYFCCVDSDVIDMLDTD